jgi:hypothetical protein
MKTIDTEKAKELYDLCKEKGIVMPESYHAWRMDSNVYMSGKREYFLYLNFAYHHPELEPPGPEKVDGIKIMRAYTLDELMIWLPGSIERKDKQTSHFKTLYINLQRDGKYFYVSYKRYSNSGEMDSEGLGQDENPSDAACQLLIWIIKEGYLTN